MTISTSLNGTRLGPPQRPPSKFPSPPAASPVNLAQPKIEPTDDLAYSAYSRLFPPPPPFTHYSPGPYAGLYQSPYTPLLRPNFAPPPPLSPLEAPYTPTTPSSSATFISPPATTYNSSSGTVQQLSSPSSQHQQTIAKVERKPSPSFKVSHRTTLSCQIIRAF